MPTYDFRCLCGLFELVAGYEDYTIACPNCGNTAERVPVYREQGLIMGDGFTKTAMPPRPETDSQVMEMQGELHKGLKKRGWHEDRVMTELRKSARGDNTTGEKMLDTSKLPKSVDKHGK